MTDDETADDFLHKESSTDTKVSIDDFKDNLDSYNLLEMVQIAFEDYWIDEEDCMPDRYCEGYSPDFQDKWEQRIEKMSVSECLEFLKEMGFIQPRPGFFTNRAFEILKENISSENCGLLSQYSSDEYMIVSPSMRAPQPKFDFSEIVRSDFTKNVIASSKHTPSELAFLEAILFEIFLGERSSSDSFPNTVRIAEIFFENKYEKGLSKMALVCIRSPFIPSGIPKHKDPLFPILSRINTEFQLGYERLSVQEYLDEERSPEFYYDID